MSSAFRLANIVIVGTSLFVGLCTSINAIGSYRSSHLAAYILRGETIQNATLKDALFTSAAHSQSCATDHLSDFVIARLRLIENLSSMLLIEDADLELTVLASESRFLLACQPTESFAWLLQFWLNSVSGTSDLSNWKFLEQSYQAGLYEGWVAARRSRIAVASFDLAPEPLQNKAVQEFKTLLEYNFVEDSVRQYASASARAKLRLGEAVKVLSATQRKSVVSRLEGLRPSVLLVDSRGGVTSSTSLVRTIPP